MLYLDIIWTSQPPYNYFYFRLVYRQRKKNFLNTDLMLFNVLAG